MRGGYGVRRYSTKEEPSGGKVLDKDIPYLTSSRQPSFSRFVHEWLLAHSLIFLSSNLYICVI